MYGNRRHTPLTQSDPLCPSWRLQFHSRTPEQTLAIQCIDSFWWPCHPRKTDPREIPVWWTNSSYSPKPMTKSPQQWWSSIDTWLQSTPVWHPKIARTDNHITFWLPPGDLQNPQKTHHRKEAKTTSVTNYGEFETRPRCPLSHIRYNVPCNQTHLLPTMLVNSMDPIHWKRTGKPQSWVTPLHYAIWGGFAAPT